MSAITAGLSTVWGERLGWMLLNSAWEIGAIALVNGLAHFCMKRGAASARYVVGSVALVCMVMSLPITLVFMSWTASRLPVASQAPGRVIVANVSERSATQETSPRETNREEPFSLEGHREFGGSLHISTAGTQSVSWNQSIAPLLPWLTAFWFAGVIVFSLRLLIGLAGVERLRRVGRKEIGPEINGLGKALAERLKVRHAVKFAESALVQVPTVIGYLRPIVLLPAVSLTGLSTREIEFLLAHELAHIRRNDYLHNIVQGIIETLLFYHPAMWWVSSCVRRERENCCDDLVVATLENRADYARTLFALEQRRTTWSPSLAASDGRLLHRIRRLIGRPASASLGRQWGKGLAGFVVLVLVIVPLAVTALSLAKQSYAIADDKNDKSSVTGNKNESGKNEQPTFVRMVAGPDKKVTFEGEETTWDGLEALLQKVPNRGSTVLEVAISTEDLSVRQMNNAISAASSHGRNLGFKYSSYIGVHPLGSKGTQPSTPAPSKTSQSPDKKGASSKSSCILELQDGSSVELIGVGVHDSEGRNWWTPDGQPLKEPPWTTWKKDGETKDGDRLQRKFAFRFHDPPNNVELGAWSFRSNGGWNGDFVGAFGSDDKEVPGALSLASMFDIDTKEAAISVGVAARPRRFVLSVDSSGKVISGSKDWVNAPTKVFITEHKEKNGFGPEDIETYFGFDRPDRYDFDDVVMAIDVDGKEHGPMQFSIFHRWDGESAKAAGGKDADSVIKKTYHNHDWGYGFTVPLSRIKEFRILARSHKTDYNWFTFENVSLQPGHSTQPKAHVDQYVAEGPQSQRVIFTPRHGMANETNWSHLVMWNVPNDKPCERLMAHVTLEGEFPVQRNEDKKPVFKVKLMAGSDESLNVKLTDSNGIPYNRVLHRGKSLSWKLNGKTYQILYPDTFVALNQPAEEPSAMITITCRSEEASTDANSSKEKGKSDVDAGARKDTNAPDESSDDSKHVGGSDMLRNIRASVAPIAAELAEKHGYGLVEGQAIRRIPPPFPELRMTYYRVGNPTQWEAIPKSPSSMTFLWANGRLQNWGMSFGAERDGDSLRHVIAAAIGIKDQEMNGSKELLSQMIPGDWVIRKGEKDEVVVKQLEKSLQGELSRPLRLAFRKVDRDVYVARGDYKLTPLPGHRAEEKMFYTDSTETTDPVEIFGAELVPNSGSGGGTGDFAEFLKWLGNWIDAPVLDETGKHPGRNISWNLNGHSTITDDTKKKDHDAELVLNNITKQTNLKFTKEKRPVRLLFVEETK